MLESALDLKFFVIERTTAIDCVDDVVTLFEGVGNGELLSHVVRVIGLDHDKLALFVLLIVNFLPDLLE